MDIQNGITTEFLDETQINFLNEHFNKKFPDVDAKITVNLNRKDYEDETNLECVMRYVLTYNHPISPEDETWFFIEQDGDEMDVFSGIESVINKYIIQTKTCDHEFDRPKDEYGSTYPDGRSVCTKCELALKNHLPRIPNKHVIKMSSHSKGVVSQFDWGKTYIQGGDSGIVFSKKGSYRTAFMEAFPKIHGMGTFIRGEGDGIQAAEQQCWEIYQRMLNCKGHEWDRHVHGALREDGYAQCKHCKMCTSDALEPLTTCSVSDKPTKKTFGDGHICHTHYFELPEEDRIREYIKMMQDSSFSTNVAKETFDYKFVSRAQKRLFHELGEDEYLEHKRRLRQIIVFIKHNFYALVLGSSPLRRRESFTEEENRLMDECHDRIIEHIGLILDHIKSDGPSRLTCKHFIAKEYWPSEE